MTDHVFPSDHDDPPYVPGEVLITLETDAQQSINQFIPDTQSTLAQDLLPNDFGVAAVDKVLKKYKPIGISKVHGVIPDARLKADDEAQPLASRLVATYRVRVDEKADIEVLAKQLNGLDEVQLAEPNYLHFTMATMPDDTLYARQWGLTSIRCPEAWDRQKGKSSIVIAVVDTGIDLNHPDLRANLVQGRDLVNLTDGRRAGSTFRDSDGDLWTVEGDVRLADNFPQDDVGHGTHVAGIIGAATDNDQGVAGVAWNCGVMPIRAMYRIVRQRDNRVSGSGTSANIATGIRWAADNGANVINLSLGSFGASQAINNAIQYAIGRNCVVVAAMGNHGTGRLAYPAAFPNVLSVGATDQSDARARFSATGAHIDVSAPGVGILSTDWNDRYSRKNGTSMATPYVAGLAGLILSCNPRLRPAEVVRIIRDTARPLRDRPSDPVPNNNYGTGLIDCFEAVKRACPARIAPIVTLPWLDNSRFTRFGYDTSFSRDLPKQRWEDIFTNPVLDTRGGIGTTPRNGDVKFPAGDKRPNLDKHPAGDRFDFDRDRFGGGRRGPSPFVLATPHHFRGADPNAELKMRYEEHFARLSEWMQAGELSEEEIEHANKLYEEYEQL